MMSLSKFHKPMSIPNPRRRNGQGLQVGTQGANFQYRQSQYQVQPDSLELLFGCRSVFNSTQVRGPFPDLPYGSAFGRSPEDEPCVLMDVGDTMPEWHEVAVRQVL